MTKDEYKQSKTEEMSRFGKVAFGIAAAVLAAFGIYGTAKHFYDKHQNRVEVETSDSIPHGLQIKYTKYKDGKPASFKWTRYRDCCENVMAEKIIDNVFYQWCMIDNKEDSTIEKGVRLWSNDHGCFDYDCNRKCDEIWNRGAGKVSRRGDAGSDEQFKTADQNLADAERLLNEEIDLEKTVEDWMEKQ